MQIIVTVNTCHKTDAKHICPDLLVKETNKVSIIGHSPPPPKAHLLPAHFPPTQANGSKHNSFFLLLALKSLFIALECIYRALARLTAMLHSLPYPSEPPSSEPRSASLTGACSPAVTTCSRAPMLSHLCWYPSVTALMNKFLCASAGVPLAGSAISMGNTHLMRMSVSSIPMLVRLLIFVLMAEWMENPRSQ
jgi:hypothetical protein